MKPLKPGRGRSLLPPLVLLALLLVVFHRVWLFDRLLVSMDAVLATIPWHHFMVEQLQAGEAPLWNPHSFAGSPLHANYQIHVFYPLTHMFNFLPAPWAMTCTGLLHVFLAGVFMLALLRDLELSRAAATAGAVAYMLSGEVSGQAAHAHLMAAQVWLPAIFLAFRRALRGGRLALAASAALLGTALLGGYDNLLYTIMALGLFALWSVRHPQAAGVVPSGPWTRALLHHLACFAAVVILGSALAAVQLLPTYELMTQGVRQGGIDYGMASKTALHPLGLLLHLLPGIFGQPGAGTLWGPGEPGAQAFGAYAGYAGAIAGLLALYASLVCARARVGFFLLLGLLSLLVALGPHTPAHRLLFEYVPGFSLFRTPLKALYVYVFSVSVLAAFGFQALITASADANVAPHPRAPALLKGVALGLGALATLAALALFGSAFGGPLKAQLVARYAALGHGVDWIATYLRHALYTAAGSMVFLAATMFVLAALLRLRPRWSPRRFAWGLGGAIAAEALWFHGLGAHPAIQMPPSVFDPPQGAAQRVLQDDRSEYRIFAPEGYRVLAHALAGMTWETSATFPSWPTYLRPYLDLVPPNLHVLYRRDSALGYDPLRIARYEPLCSLWRAARPIIGRPLDPASDIKIESLDSGVFDLLNIKYLLTREPVSSDRWELLASSPVRLYRNRLVLPRTFLVQAARVFDRPDQLLAAMRESDFDPRAAVLLEAAAPPPVAAKARAAGSLVGVRRTRNQPRRIAIEATLEQTGFLVMSETHYPGWSLEVDGHRAPLLRAYYALRAVHLGPGTHSLELHYDPPSYRWGWWLSLCTLLLLLAVVIPRAIYAERR